jgi:hypothetical protein
MMNAQMSVSEKLASIYNSAPMVPKDQTVKALQSVLYDISGNQKNINNQEVAGYVKTALVHYQNKATNHGSALGSLRNALVKLSSS